MPPMGMSRIRRTPMPKCIAVNECPSSCSTTQVKNAEDRSHVPSHPDPAVGVIAFVSYPRQQQVKRGMNRQLYAADAEKVR
jgi:hypothetical protein